MQRQQSLLRNRHVRRLLLSAATGAILVGTAAGPVFAGPQHNNTDPARTGCNSNARLIATRPIETEFGQVVSYVDVYYSLSCTTNWIRVRNNPAGGLAVKYLWASNGNTTTAQSDYGSGSSYSYQVYAPGSTCISFQVKLKYPDGRHYAETYIAGANAITIC